ncbi:DUF6225 family protein [Kitasatospora sp. NPDC005856]|uniref:DUF6225 family protein n=1 Tax=Kitasatospora sp. NPDC005856 TaxID=3154566 RepID=UPI0033C9039F
MVGAQLDLGQGNLTSGAVLVTERTGILAGRRRLRDSPRDGPPAHPARGASAAARSRSAGGAPVARVRRPSGRARAGCPGPAAAGSGRATPYHHTVDAWTVGRLREALAGLSDEMPIALALPEDGPQ